MAKMNYSKVQTQNRVYKYGLEIDKTVGSGYDRRPKKDKTEKIIKIAAKAQPRPKNVQKVIVISRKAEKSDYI